MFIHIVMCLRKIVMSLKRIINFKLRHKSYPKAIRYLKPPPKPVLPPAEYKRLTTAAISS